MTLKLNEARVSSMQKHLYAVFAVFIIGLAFDWTGAALAYVLGSFIAALLLVAKSLSEPAADEPVWFDIGALALLVVLWPIAIAIVGFLKSIASLVEPTPTKESQ